MFDEYVGRKYKYLVEDCGTIIIEFLKKELNIEIKDVNRRILDLKHRPFFVYDSWVGAGFADTTQPPKKGDIILGKCGRTDIAHCGVFVDEAKVLRILPNSFSEIIDVNEYGPIDFRLRYKGK